MEITDESGVRGEVSGKIRAVVRVRNAWVTEIEGEVKEFGGDITSNGLQLVGRAGGTGGDEGNGDNASWAGRLRSRESPRYFWNSWFRSLRFPVGPASKPTLVGTV